ncbi:unnamed protein product, partial [Linum tenue]
IDCYGVGKVVASGNPEFQEGDLVAGLLTWGEYSVLKYFPDGIDVYFDNVGGEMLEAAIDNMNAFGRVAVCGVISEYTGTGRRAAPNMVDVIYKRLTIRGFLANDFMPVFPEFISKACEHMGSGKMVSIEDISVGLDSIPSAFVDLFTGGNVGKKIVQIAQE